ncbi:transcription factor bHLH121 [Benincasa hispida]|uniref:transcription factor bHLH121 n=1 Tax=Benincasa hispida TaxID=102211 RepID=UPI0018FF6711|nr:transcription factor bHLH121 [Benincasa hispida]
MDQLIQRDDLVQNLATPSTSIAPCIELPGHPIRSQSSSRSEGEFKDSATARKVQKADREKLRRGRLNEQFVELGNILDPDRPKNDKATILMDTIQLLKDLTSQVNKLKTEYATLTEESNELAQEKNDLREEKALLKSDIENLNAQYQQNLRATYPWAAMDHSVVMSPTPFPFPVPMQMPPGPFPLHPSLQPYTFFGNPDPRVITNPCSTFVPFVPPNSLTEQQSSRNAPPFIQSGNQSHNLSKQSTGSKSSSESKIEKSVDSNEVATYLELKTPGSSTDQDTSFEQTNSKNRQENNLSAESSLSRCSSSCSLEPNSFSSTPK